MVLIFSHANLKYVSFIGACLNNANLINADISDINIGIVDLCTEMDIELKMYITDSELDSDSEYDSDYNKLEAIRRRSLTDSDYNKLESIRRRTLTYDNYAYKEAESVIYKSSIAFSENGKLFATSYGRYISIWSAETNEIIHKLINEDKGAEYISALAFSPDGKYIVAGLNPSTTAIVRKRNRTIIKKICYGEVYEIKTGKIVNKICYKHPNPFERPTKPFYLNRYNEKRWLRCPPEYEDCNVQSISYGSNGKDLYIIHHDELIRYGLEENKKKRLYRFLIALQYHLVLIKNMLLLVTL